MSARQLRDGLRQHRLLRIVHRANAVPGQSAFPRALADFIRADAGRQRDVGLNAAMLRALASDAVVLADRHGQLTEARIATERIAVERIQVLHRALTEGLLAHDDAAAIVLDGRRKDLR